jgi:uncharacterized membrane protein YfcA
MNLISTFLASDALTQAVVVLLTFLLAGFVKGVIGMGLPTVAVGLLGLVMAPMEAASLLIVPSLVTNVWQLAAGPNFRGIGRRLWPMLIAIWVGTWAGATVFGGVNIGYATAALGAALLLYGLLGLSAVRLAIPAGTESWLSPLIGAATGVTAAVTGVFVIPAVPYLQALNMNKEELIQALGLAFTISTLALAASLWGAPAFRPAVVGSSFLAVVPAVIGMFVGQWIRTRVSPTTFRTCFFLGLLALGVHLVVRSFG